ncbi:MAG: Gfo/Idh/MocA family oxidoreductase [Nocardioides sp.]
MTDLARASVPPEESTAQQTTLRYGIVGMGFIAQLHLDALERLAHYCDAGIEIVAGADTDPGVIQRFPHQLPRVSHDYRDVTRADDVDVVIVAVPNDQHHAVVHDALEHGKIIVCEKPLAATIEDARSIHVASVASGREHCVAFVFRTWPTVELAKQIIDRGEIGEVFGYRGHMVHGHGLDPAYPTSWRMDPNRSGGGVVVDIGSHALDIARYLVGEVAAVSAVSRTVVPERPLVDDPQAQVPVEVDDHTAMQVKFQNGATGQVMVTWAAAGESTDVAFEVLGTKGSLRFTWRRAEELYVARLGQHPQTVVIGPTDPDHDLRFPVAGLGLGYVDAFMSLHKRVVDHHLGRVAAPFPSVTDAWRCALVVDAAQRSAAAGGEWQSTLPEPPSIAPTSVALSVANQGVQE